ncbi:hypothetical protein BLOT_005359 [Blomia tropicalis]|nr:hypothetical protein BLOT_005359 [Blomia tropicalis]
MVMVAADHCDDTMEHPIDRRSLGQTLWNTNLAAGHLGDTLEHQIGRRTLRRQFGTPTWLPIIGTNILENQLGRRFNPLFMEFINPKDFTQKQDSN